MANITRFLPGGLSATDTVGGGAGAYDATTRGYPASITNVGISKIREFANTFSLAAVTAGPGQRAATTPAVNDVIQLLTVPKNYLVLGIRFEVVVPDTTASLTVATCSVSDGTSLIASINGLAAAGTQYSTTTPKLYTADTVISLIPGTLTGATTMSNGAYRIVVLAVDMTGQETTALITG